MESALEASPFRAQHIWDLIPSSPPPANHTSHQAYLQTLSHLISFTALWLGAFPFLADENAELPRTLAQVAEVNLKSWSRLRGDSSQTWLLEAVERMLVYLKGSADAKHPLAALLEDVHWPGREHLRTNCKEIINARIRGVYRRLMAAPNFAPRLQPDEMEACAIVWLGFKGGLNNLTRYQRLTLAVKAHTVSLALLAVTRPSWRLYGNSMLSAFEAGAKEDQEEAEAILADFEALSKDFQLWAHARITRTTENERGELKRESEQVREIEQAQELGRTKLASFMDTFKGAFKALLG
ncbi:hypothetical protein BCR35DRAFT_327544 [Leucosporidium creatinivorum]|uniref:Uncharacterized protein n=1 Tax=Leucosporidium creatinivorum TaxID=106004 RepID=A0A1Y2G397_9BASI|nr:hypothetical protein BCR35DRAFT_327544 [Leucosporidium creatinivorum]